MATTTITNNARRDYAAGNVINAASDTWKMALYNGSGHGVNTTAYTVTSEAVGSGYNPGGVTMTGFVQTTDTSNNVSYYDWDDVSLPSSTITATDCMIYDDTVTSPTANVAIYIGDFSGSRSSNNGLFQVVLPGAAYNTAIIRFA